MAQKAFKLHEAIQSVRSLLKGEVARTPDAKKPDVPAAKPKEKDKEPVPSGGAGGPGVRGVVTLMGKPLAGGDVIFVSLDQPKPRVFTAQTQDDGQFAPMEAVPPGKYVVAVQGKGVPAKYQLTTTSGLIIDVQAPPSVHNINLQ